MCSSKGWGLTAPLICIAMGITGIVISLYMYTFEDYSYVISVNSQYGGAIILTIFSVLALLAGCFGVCAVLQLNQGMMTAFWIVLTVCIFGFSAGAGIGVGTPILFASYGCNGQVYPGVFSIANQTTQAYLRLCVYNNCTCYIDPAGQYNKTVNLTTTLNAGYLSNRSFPISVLQCANWTEGVYDRSIGAFQTNFNCSGWCTKSDRYLFSDVNRGVPSSSCFQSFATWFVNFQKYAFITCFIFAFMSIVLVIWICVFQKYCMLQDEEFIEINEVRSSVMI